MQVDGPEKGCRVFWLGGGMVPRRMAKIPRRSNQRQWRELEVGKPIL
jgi:hypothetical protein